MKNMFFDLELIARQNGNLFDEMLANVNKKASSKYMHNVSNLYLEQELDEIEYMELYDEHCEIRDQILEETEDKYQGKINYFENYLLDDSNKLMIEYIQKVMDVFPTYIIYFYNTSRECEEKKRICELYFPNAKIMALRYYNLDYHKNLQRIRNNKALFVKKKLSLSDLQGCFLFDKSIASCDEWTELGGMAVLPRDIKKQILDEKKSKSR